MRNSQEEHWTALYHQTQMQGWDFSRLDGSLTTESEPWDFEEISLNMLFSSNRALDMGTGGGERLVKLLHALPQYVRPHIVATEGWEPNLPVAQKNLAPYNIKVHAYNSEKKESLEEEAASFNLLMNRHEAVDFDEVYRLLTPGDYFITQQVAGNDAAELREWLGGVTQYPEVTLPHYQAECERRGLVVESAKNWQGWMKFASVDSLIQYLALVPWDVPDFQVEKNLAKLQQLSQMESIEVTQSRFLIIARKPQLSEL